MYIKKNIFCNKKYQNEAIKWHKLIVRLIAWLQILIERLVAIKNFSLIPTLLRIVRVYVRLIFLKLKKLTVKWFFQTVNVAHRHFTVYQKTNRIILQTNRNCKKIRLGVYLVVMLNIKLDSTKEEKSTIGPLHMTSQPCHVTLAAMSDLLRFTIN